MDEQEAFQFGVQQPMAHDVVAGHFFVLRRSSLEDFLYRQILAELNWNDRVGPEDCGLIYISGSDSNLVTWSTKDTTMYLFYL